MDDDPTDTLKNWIWSVLVKEICVKGSTATAAQSAGRHVGKNLISESDIRSDFLISDINFTWFTWRTRLPAEY